MTRVVKSNWQVNIVNTASSNIDTTGMPRLSTLLMIFGNILSSAMTKNALEPCAIYEQNIEQFASMAIIMNAVPAQLPTYCISTSAYPTAPPPDSVDHALHEPIAASAASVGST